ncbi:hypothetical protein BOX15_Mlig000183g1 [Macrostomum lignano]|uniref:Conserved oligomeric Golgi complex subunit 6 n=2 Tax=Macrostomum lignano TaxID=282301 RepID=A0A1I8IQ17_9PLAT|nr:hypothetical protein BOX15_Mlig000183g1 [Macrostomum lignano]
MQAYLSRLEAHIAAARARCNQLNNNCQLATDDSSLSMSTNSIGANPHLAARQFGAIERANRLARRRLTTASLRRLASQIGGAAEAASLVALSSASKKKPTEAEDADSAEAALARLAKEAAEIQIHDEEQPDGVVGDGDNQDAAAAVPPETLAHAAQSRACLDCLLARRSLAAAESDFASLSEQFSRHLQLAGLSPDEAALVVAYRANGCGAAERAGADARRRYAASLSSVGGGGGASEHASAVALRRRLIGAAADRLRANQGAIAALLRGDARVDLAEQRRLASRLMLDSFQRPDSELALLAQEAATATTLAAVAASSFSNGESSGESRLKYQTLADEGHGLYSLHRLLEDEIRAAESRAIARRSGAAIGAAAASLRRSCDALKRRQADAELSETSCADTVDRLLAECEPLIDQLSVGVDQLHASVGVHRSQPAFRLSEKSTGSGLGASS